MKNLFAAILVALTVSTSSVSFAAPKTTDIGQKNQVSGTSVSFGQVEKSKVDVIVQSADNTKMTIRLTDSSGNTIATKSLTDVQDGTRVRFDLSNLTDGLYHVKVWDGHNSQVKNIELKTNVPATALYKDIAIL